MMTKDEAFRLNEIKALIKDGRMDCVTIEDKQWVVDLLKREQVVVRKSVRDCAKNSGLDVSGVLVK